MKKLITSLAALGMALLLLIATPAPSSGQAENDPATNALIAEITAQQTILAENQVKMDEKIALIAEEIRLARLHVARGGGNARSNP